ncbi:MAG: Na+/H+ antiporter [Ktedonobacterales bacterium]|nr:Na+/H+ antiporter [Ktedonobacterales bacterium]
MPEATVGIVLTLLIVTAFVAIAVRIIRIPYSIALVLVGGALAFLPGIPDLVLSPGVILTLFLPVLLFHGAYHLDLAELRANLLAVVSLAFPGVLLTAGLVGLALHLVAQLPWPTAFLFGAIVAATDPVAVLSLFGELGAPRRLATIVTGESLFNDGTALVVFATLLSIIQGEAVTPASIGLVVLIEVVGGIALGLGIGLIGSLVLARINDALIETTITLVMAYGGFLLATAIGSSGPLETVTAALMLGARRQRAFSSATRLAAGATWEFLDFLANSFLFLLVGLQLRPILVITQSGQNIAWEVVSAILAVIIARVIVVWLTMAWLAARHQPLPPSWGVTFVWAGLRGAVSLAAALSLPLGYGDRSLVLVLTFAVVLFTLLVQGLTIRSILLRFQVVAARAASAFDLAWGRLTLLERGRQAIARLRAEQRITPQVSERLDAEYGALIETQQATLAALVAQDTELVAAQEFLARRAIFQAQRDALEEEALSGQLAPETLAVLLQEVDEQANQLLEA